MSFHKLTICLIITFLFVEAARGEWPTEPLSSIQLTTTPDYDEVALGAIEAQDGTMRVLVWSWEETSYEYQVGLISLNRDGTSQWGDYNPRLHPVHTRSNWFWPAQYLMKCGSNGETWVVYEDFYQTPDDGNGYREEHYVSLRCINEFGEPTSPLLEVSSHDWGWAKAPTHLEPLPDGSAILIWYETELSGAATYYYAQRFSSTLEPLWGDNGVLLYSSVTELDYLMPATHVHRGISDGAGGIYYPLAGSVIHLRPNGELPWAVGDVMVDSSFSAIALEWNESLQEIGVFCARLDDDLNSHYSFRAVDTLGVVRESDIDFTAAGINRFEFYSMGYNGYRVTVINYPYFMEVNSELELVTDPTSYPWIDTDFSNVHMYNKGHSQVCLSASYYGADQNRYSENELVYCYDLGMNPIRSVQVTEDTTQQHNIIPYIDRSGNTWAFWCEDRIGFDHPRYDLFANVFDPDGVWGQLPVDEISQTFKPDYLIYPLTYPNPFNDVLRIEFSIPRMQTIKFEVTDILGRSVLSFDHYYSSGRQMQSISFSQLSSGVYVVNLLANDIVFQPQTVVLIK